MYQKRRAGRCVTSPACAWVGLALAAAVWLATGVPAALANGGATEVFRAKQGPYEIAVGIVPPTPLVGSVHLTVTVLDIARKWPVTEAEVAIEALGPQGSSPRPIAATNTYGASQYYDANISLDTPGEWQFQVAVDSTLGKERVAFHLRVYEAKVNWGAVITLLVAVLLLLPLAASGYRSLRGRRGAQSTSKRR